MKIDVKDIILAALFHDIGKVMQRADAPKSVDYEHCRLDRVSKAKSHLHVDWTYSFLKQYNLNLDVDEWLLVCELAASHHDIETFGQKLIYQEHLWLANCIIIADRLASAWDREAGEESGGRRYQKVPLYSIFQKVDVHHGAKEIAAEAAYALPLSKLSPETSFPEKGEETSDKKEKYRLLWNDFAQAAEELKQNYQAGQLNLTHFVDALDNLLQEHFWSVPANTMESHPTNSLYFHLKNTASIAAAIYLAYKDSPEKVNQNLIFSGDKDFRLLSLDLCGIQDYIFDLNKESTSKTSKFLRARSFQIKIILEMALEWILAELELPRQCVLFKAAGKAFVLMPNQPELIAKLVAIQAKLELEIYRRYLGALTLLINWETQISLQELDKQNFTGTIDACLDCLEAEKRKKFSRILQNGVWQQERFVFKESAAVRTDEICGFCRHRKADKVDEGNTPMCIICAQDEKLGKALVRGNMFKLSREKDGGLLKLGEIILAEAKEGEIDNLEAESYYFAIKSRPSVNICHAPYAAGAPLNEYGALLTFDEIAGKAEGVKANAVLKGDVDNLGLIFRSGIVKLKDKEKKELSLTTYATISAQLDYFFSVYLPEFVRKHKEFKDSIYIVYAGGDDFCLVGAYDRIIEFAGIIRDDFERYVCHNPQVHFSAAIELMHTKSPISAAIERAEEQLKRAKQDKDRDAPLNLETVLAKDRLAIFGLTVRWKRMKDLLEFGSKVESWLADEDEKGVTTQFIYRLIAYSDMYLRTLEPEPELHNYLYDSLLNNDIKRNIQIIKNNLLINEETVQTIRNLTDIGEDNILDVLKIPLIYILYKNRKPQGGKNVRQQNL